MSFLSRELNLNLSLDEIGFDELTLIHLPICFGTEHLDFVLEVSGDDSYGSCATEEQTRRDELRKGGEERVKSGRAREGDGGGGRLTLCCVWTRFELSFERCRDGDVDAFFSCSQRKVGTGVRKGSGEGRATKECCALESLMDLPSR